MRRAVWLFGTVLILSTPAPAAGQLVLFEQPGYAGRSVRLTEDVPDLRSLGFNDAASAARVSADCRAILFSDSGYRGARWGLDPASAWSDFRSFSGLNDVASSARVDCSGNPGDGWPGGGSGGQGGVALYTDSNFAGTSQILRGDEARLSSTRVGDDSVSSLRVSPGCRATLYSEPNFRGSSMVLDRDVENLRYMPVGNDSASSIRVDCRDDGSGGGRPGGGGNEEEGVTLYRDSNFRGTSETFFEDVPSLLGTRIGNDSASSVRVSPRCRVRLYADGDFRGATLEVEDEVDELRYTPVGNDSVSSLRVDCGGSGRRKGITLYHDAGFRGGSEKFTADVTELGSGTGAVGNDHASSIRLDPGCAATLYSDRDFRGRSVRVTSDVSNLGSTPVGNDQVSSFRVECGGGGGSPGGGGARRSVTLFRDGGYRSPVGDYSRDNPSFNAPIGSVKVDSGCQITFYERPNYQGRSVQVTDDRTNLGLSGVGSFRVNCGY